jgi:hypothetical protein
VNLTNSTTAYNAVISDNGLKGLKHVGIVTKNICTWIIFVHNIITSYLLCYGYETLFLILWEEHGVDKMCYRPKREEIPGGEEIA